MKVIKTAALVFSAVFLFSGELFAQVEVVDRSAAVNVKPTPASPPPAQAPQSVGAQQGELFYQLQLIQQEIMQLRGIVEEQGHQLQRLKQQSMERYIDLDRRIGTGNAQEKPELGKGQQTTVLPKTASDSEKEAYAAAYNMVTSKQFELALKAFKQFLADYPDGRYTPNSYYWLGELYQVINPQDLEAARQAFTQMLDRFPDHSKAPDAMYKLGKVYFLKGNKEKSRTWLEMVVAKYDGNNLSAVDKAKQFIRNNF